MNKIIFAIRNLIVPGPHAKFDERRSSRMTFLGILAGIVIAVTFGFVLYYLNSIGRITR